MLWKRERHDIDLDFNLHNDIEIDRFLYLLDWLALS